ncbi:hypothetical protein JX265_009115 [Neoarthrinium moseri]|uniref:Uncharacterized protein n=1 Tax=Neoarthrinium moseri TaxID=1658444 RepID=A0A9P9WGG2_9PEZI|nr:hypothetical protein JX266_013771 [Neoarthrinium moseri]KAI1862401.1 hypothetical protein JX265_009115 [Neoarthrinium moseri]
MKSGAIAEERRRSFGIGGAGNIRTRTEAMVDNVVPQTSNQNRRRSSTFSKNSSTTGEATTIMDKFKHVLRSSTEKKSAGEK